MPRRITHKHCRHNFWSLIDKAIRASYRRRCIYPYTMPIWNQRGGDMITVNGHTFEYIPDISGTQILIRGGKTVGNLPCFRLSIDSSGPQTFAVLDDLLKGNTCSVDGSASTVDMVFALIEIAKIYGAKWIELSDESGICKSGDQSVSLSQYSILTKGKTWYEYHFGFQPDDTELVEYIKQNAEQSVWEHIMQDIPLSKRRAILRDIQGVSLDGIDTHAPGSTRLVLQRVPYNVRCAFYRKHLPILSSVTHVAGIKGTVWFLPLARDYNRPSFQYQF